ncbi:MAG: hypothetical protein IT422_05140 [Pirellulaceae bacterium]|nr:hypothetical protein [Pirellulaceae bacterium]
MSGTHLFYNGVLMRDCEMIEFAQVIEYDESETDPLYSRFRLTVASTLISLHSTNPSDGPPINLGDTSNALTRQHLSTIALPAVTGETVVDRLQFIESRLQQPRKDFWLALNATTNKPLVNNSPDQFTPAKDSSANDSYRIVLAATGIDDFADMSTDENDGTKGGRKVTGMLAGATQFTNVQIERKDVVDANNGPKPQGVNVVQINGGRSMRVQVTIEVCRPLCQPSTDPTTHPIRDAKKVKGVISNRWSIQETLNENWEAEIVIEGTLIISDQRFKADSMRLMTSTGMFPYAKMTGRMFSTSADGLKLKYRYTIKEAGISPPPYIVDWSGKYSESMQTGGKAIGTMNVKVRGTHKIPATIKDFNGEFITDHRRYKLYLTDWIMLIIQSRLAVADAFDPEPGKKPDTMVPVDFVVIENMKEPEIEARLTVLHSGPDPYKKFSVRLHNFGKTIYDATNPALANWDPTEWPIPPAFTWEANPRHNKMGSAYDCYFQSPCSQWHGKPEGLARDFDLQQPPTDPVEENVPTTEAYLYGGDTSALTVGLPTAIPNPVLPLTSYGWSDENLAQGFTHLSVDIENHYDGNTGILALPLSKQRNTESGPATVAFIPVHAGIQGRTFRMLASRQGAWPKVPAPMVTISNSSAGYVEKLMKAEVLPSAPKLESDGRTLRYTVEVKWTYVSSRPIGANAGDAYRTSSDPMDKTTPTTNLLPIDSFYDYSGSIEAT